MLWSCWLSGVPLSSALKAETQGDRGQQHGSTHASSVKQASAMMSRALYDI